VSRTPNQTRQATEGTEPQGFLCFLRHPLFDPRRGATPRSERRSFRSSASSA